MNNKLYRLNEFIPPADGRSLIIDTSGGLIFGALPGLEKFAAAVEPILPLADGIVTSPGQARALATRTREDAALLVRADWTNALRGDNFVLPPERISYIPLLEAGDALNLGASALVTHFLLGFEETIELRCVERVVQLALNGSPLGLPVIVDAQPIGPRVVLRGKAIELCVSYALESGADGVIIPWPGVESFKTIRAMAQEVPVWLKPATLDANAPEIAQALDLGAVGLWLDERVFAQPEPLAAVEAFRKLTHATAPQPA
jgi:DhnA family fructose-bisphosphate aldolase class Ia